MMIDLDNPRTIGEQIQEACKDNRLSVNELCHRAGVSPSVVSNWKREDPHSLQILRRLNEAMAELKLPNAGV